MSLGPVDKHFPFFSEKTSPVAGPVIMRQNPACRVAVFAGMFCRFCREPFFPVHLSGIMEMPVLPVCFASFAGNCFSGIFIRHHEIPVLPVSFTSCREPVLPVNLSGTTG